MAISWNIDLEAEESYEFGYNGRTLNIAEPVIENITKPQDLWYAKISQHF